MDRLRAFQKSALQHLRLSDAHVICVAATGSGKSLIYERAAAEISRRTVLISPLVALARQQRRKLEALGLRVWHGWVGNHFPRVGESGVWILSPESVFRKSSRGISLLSAWRPHLLVCDECHCIEEWGRSFRPEFSEVPTLIRRLEIRKSLWLTATLPWSSRIQLRAHLPNPRFEVGDFALPHSLRFRTLRVSWTERLSALFRWLEDHPEPGVIFTRTRQNAERFWNLLRQQGMDAQYYHAGLGHEERVYVETRTRKSPPHVTIATCAFAMGMDIPHLRWVLLIEPPNSLLQLAQMIGRVGRGTTSGLACVWWDLEDFSPKEPSEVRDFLAQSGCREGILRKAFHPENTLGASGTDLTLCNRCDSCQAQNLIN